MHGQQRDQYASVREVAQRLAVSPHTVRHWIKRAKTLPAQKIGRQWKIRERDLLAFIQREGRGEE